MSTLRTVWESIFAPKLIKIYGNGPVEVRILRVLHRYASELLNVCLFQRLYEPSTFERWGDQVLQSVSLTFISSVSDATSETVFSALHDMETRCIHVAHNSWGFVPKRLLCCGRSGDSNKVRHESGSDSGGLDLHPWHRQIQEPYLPEVLENIAAGRNKHDTQC